MTREEIIQGLYRGDSKAIKEAIKILEQEVCEDAISRARALSDYADWYGYGYRDNTFYKLLKDMPSVTPKTECSCDQIKWERDMVIAQLNELGYGLGEKPRTGHWILKRAFPTKIYNEYLNEYKCSECYRGIRCTKSQLVNYPYCHCGARMVEPHESENK